jgi:hypothetical protein
MVKGKCLERSMGTEPLLDPVTGMLRERWQGSVLVSQMSLP